MYIIYNIYNIVCGAQKSVVFWLDFIVIQALTVG